MTAINYQAGLGVNSMWPFCVYGVDDQSALYMCPQVQPIELYRLTNQDYVNVNGPTTYRLINSNAATMKMADGVTTIPVNGNYDAYKDLGSGVMLAVITSSGSGKSYVVRSHNYGASWGSNDNNDKVAVLNLGDTATNGKSDGTTQTNLINALGSRGICKCTVGDVTFILIAEYNTNAAASSDPVAAATLGRVWRSDDLGKNWSIFLTFNTNIGGNRQIRHIHSIVQNPYTGYIYFCLGDSALSGILRWDGVSAAPPANTLPADFGNYPGWLGIGASNWTKYINGSGQTNIDVWQVTDLIFTQDWIFNGSDNTGSAAVNRGIWAFQHDFTGLRRAYNGGTRTGHSGYWGLKHSSGLLYVVEIIDVTAGDGILYFQSSNDFGATWVECAKFVYKTTGTTGSIDAFFERLSDGSIWVSTGQAKTAVPAANRSSYCLYPTRLFASVSAVSGG